MIAIKCIFGVLPTRWLFTESKLGKEFWEYLFFHFGAAPPSKTKEFGIVKNFREHWF